MAKVKVVTLERSFPLAPPANADGGVESRAYLNGERDPLHLLHHALPPGATMQVVGEPTDKLVYVFEGSATACGKALASGSSMIVEFGAAAEVAAGAEGAVILTLNQAKRPADARPGGHVHVLPREAVPCVHDLGTQNEMGGGLHADAACSTCTVWLHENDFHSKSGTVVPPHAHSEDEIIFVTAGQIRLGNRLYGPGTALAVAADTVYGFEVPPTGLSFINFRAASPTVTTQNGTVMMDEAEFWVSRLGKPRYAEIDPASA